MQTCFFLVEEERTRSTPPFVGIPFGRETEEAGSSRIPTVCASYAKQLHCTILAASRLTHDCLVLCAGGKSVPPVVWRFVASIGGGLDSSVLKHSRGGVFFICGHGAPGILQILVAFFCIQDRVWALCKRERMQCSPSAQ